MKVTHAISAEKEGAISYVPKTRCSSDHFTFQSENYARNADLYISWTLHLETFIFSLMQNIVLR